MDNAEALSLDSFERVWQRVNPSMPANKPVPDIELMPSKGKRRTAIKFCPHGGVAD